MVNAIKSICNNLHRDENKYRALTGLETWRCKLDCLLVKFKNTKMSIGTLTIFITKMSVETLVNFKNIKMSNEMLINLILYTLFITDSRKNHFQFLECQNGFQKSSKSLETMVSI